MSHLWNVLGIEQSNGSAPTETPSVRSARTVRRSNLSKHRSVNGKNQRNIRSSINMSEGSKSNFNYEGEERNEHSILRNSSNIENTAHHNNSSEKPSILLRLIKQKDWDDVIVRCREYPHETELWYVEDNVDGSIRWRILPLHQACELNPPARVIQSLLLAYPNAIDKKDSGGFLPIHLACRERAADDVIESLLCAFLKAVEVQDDDGRLPLHLASRKGTTLHVINILLKAFYQGAQTKDAYGLLPIHWACSQNAAPEVVEALIRAFPSSTRVKDKWGRTPLALVQGSSNPDKDAIMTSLNRDESYWSTSLLDEISSLKSELRTNTVKKQAYKDRASVVESKLEEAQRAAAKNEQDKDHLQREREQLKKTLIDETERSTALKKENTLLQRTLSNLTNQKKGLDKKVHELRGQVDVLSVKNVAMEEKFEHVANENSDLKMLNQILEARVQKLSGLIQIMNEEHSQMFMSAGRLDFAFEEAGTLVEQWNTQSTTVSPADETDENDPIEVSDNSISNNVALSD